MLALIALCAFLMVTLVAVALWQRLAARQAQLGGRIETIAQGAPPVFDRTGRPLLRMQSYSTLPYLQRFLQRTPRAERIADDLDRAGLRLTVGQYVVLSLAFGMFLALAVMLALPFEASRIPVAVLVFLGGVYIPRWFVKRSIRRRRAKIEAALPDALAMLSRSLRSGSGLFSAIETMTEQIGGPISVEFMRLQQEIATGLAVEEAFRELDRRVASKDLHIVATAILIQREVGGNLTEILDNVAGMMRERVKLRGEMKTLISRNVFSTYAMAAMPPLVVLLLTLVDRSFMQPLFDNKLGWLLLGVAATLELIGFLIVKRMASSPIEV